jgi:hypothetical protein
MVARRILPGERWDAGVRVADGRPRSNAKKGRSLAVD